jgi:hypothetical protein
VDLRERYFDVPPPSDLILMAVREAFDDQVAGEFGLDANFPAPFATYGRQIGIDEQWAKRYWRSHWNLPSTEQGFEMFHRGELSRASSARVRPDLHSPARQHRLQPAWPHRPPAHVRPAPSTASASLRLSRLGYNPTTPRSLPSRRPPRRRSPVDLPRRHSQGLPGKVLDRPGPPRAR